MAFKEKEFVRIELDTYANGKLVQTTDKKKGEREGLKVPEEGYKPQLIVFGKGLLLERLEEEIKKSKIGERKRIDLSVDEAFGKKKKELLRTFPKKVFDEKRLRAVVGVVYDFNGMLGTVKSVVGGRVMVDFNNPLAGKNVSYEFEIKEVVDDVKERLDFIFSDILRLPKEMIPYEVDGKKVVFKMPKHLISFKEQFLKTFEEYFIDFKDVSFVFEEVDKK